MEAAESKALFECTGGGGGHIESRDLVKEEPSAHLASHKEALRMESASEGRRRGGLSRRHAGTADYLSCTGDEKSTGLATPPPISHCQVPYHWQFAAQLETVRSSRMSRITNSHIDKYRSAQAAASAAVLGVAGDWQTSAARPGAAECRAAAYELE
eukprot:752787-Hanusia_phi.AAC.1